MAAPDDLRAMAAEAYAELCRPHATYGKGEKEQYPKPLRGLNVDRLKELGNPNGVSPGFVNGLGCP